MKNIFLLSEEKENFNNALKEWYFTGESVDYVIAKETCELCEKSGLRYHFKIINGLNNFLFVGSNCIDKFDIKITDEFGNEIKEGKNAYLINLAKNRHVENKLNTLVRTEAKGKMYNYNKTESFYKIQLDYYCMDYFNKNHKLNARILNYLFLRFEEESIKFDPKSFALNLKNSEGKKKLLQLNIIQFERIKMALSSSQIKYYETNKK